MTELNGINLAMQTPMHADGSIDYSRWQELIDIYVDAGVRAPLQSLDADAEREIACCLEPLAHE
ncbi:MAG: hypothetical protein GY815_10885 [Gammaproteobacteria bacterium]|nr:hypothetical protein [Gammaproteobacteria bacterium]